MAMYRTTPLNYWWLLLGFLPFALALALYSGGLNSSLALDDQRNLEPLLRLPADPSFAALLDFIRGGVGFGRHIAMASFAADYVIFGNEPWAFRLTNLLLHLLNGLLLFSLLYRFLKLVDDNQSRQHFFIALLATSLWLLHPLQASTVLYVVQRMAELSALFILIGLHVYLTGRQAWYAGRSWAPGFTLASLIGIAVVGVFAKENAALLPLCAGVLEVIWLRKRLPLPKTLSVWLLWLVLLSPLLLMGRYAVLYLTDIYGYRAGLTPEERLLSEGRVLWDYIGQILLPRPQLMGLAHDDFPVSKGWLLPPTTLPAWLGLAALGGMAVGLSRRHPWLTFAIAWFFAAHLVESTVMPLELYFEHRNYLPLVGPMAALAYYTLSSTFAHRLPRAVLGSLLVGLIFGTSLYNAQLWANPTRLGETWASYHPDSLRANEFAVQRWLEAGRADRAIPYLDRLQALEPEEICYRLGRLNVLCWYGLFGVPRSEYQAALEVAKTGKACQVNELHIRNLTLKVLEAGCGVLDKQHLVRLLEALAANEATRISQRAYALEAIARAYGKVPQARFPLRRAIELEPQIERYLWLAKAEAAAGNADKARAALDNARERMAEDPLRAKVLQPKYEQDQQVVETLLAR